MALAEILGARHEPREIALKTDALTLRFGGLTAVDNVSLEVRSGTVHALIGPNGAGKSSLLNLISGFYVPTEGSISFFGAAHRRTAEPRARAPRHRAHVPEHRAVRADDRAGERARRIPSHYRNTLAETLLRLPRFGREERRVLRPGAPASRISSGSPTSPRRRPATCRSATSAGSRSRGRWRCGRLLLLDEPAAGLTHGEIEDLKALIRLLAEHGITVILVEHHVEMVMTVSDHVTVLDYGRVIASGSAGEVQNNPQVIEAYFGTAASCPPRERAVSAADDAGAAE